MKGQWERTPYCLKSKKINMKEGAQGIIYIHQSVEWPLPWPNRIVLFWSNFLHSFLHKNWDTHSTSRVRNAKMIISKMSPGRVTMMLRWKSTGIKIDYNAEVRNQISFSEDWETRLKMWKVFHVHALARFRILYPHQFSDPDPGTSYKPDLDLDPHQSGNSDPDSDLRRESRIRNIWLQIRNTTVPVQYL